ncbi:MAG: PAS domain S-box protein [Desulfobacterota bacterium]|nr:PAS domain S-box protein [Thermodesulfobacteriota bacterium]
MKQIRESSEKDELFNYIGEKNLQNLIEKLPFPLFIVNSEEKVLYLNEAAEKIYQCDHSTSISRPLAQILFLIETEIISNALREIFKGQKLLIEEWKEEQYYEGRIFWRQGYFFPLVNPEGKVNYVVVIILDITERIRTEKSLRKSLDEFRRFFENSFSPIFILKADQLVGCNLAGEKMLGKPREEFLEKNLWEICPEFQEDNIPSEKLAQEKVRAALNGSTQSFKWNYKGKNGKVIKTETKLTPLTSSENLLLLAVVQELSTDKA